MILFLIFDNGIIECVRNRCYSDFTVLYIVKATSSLVEILQWKY